MRIDRRVDLSARAAKVLRIEVPVGIVCCGLACASRSVSTGLQRRRAWAFPVLLVSDGARWSRQRGAAPADVTVQTSPAELVKFLSADPEGRRRWLRQQRAAGTRQRLDELMTSFGVLQQTLRSREPGSQRAAMAKN